MSIKVEEIDKDMKNIEELDGNQKTSLWEQNKKIIMTYVSSSKITCIAFVVIWVCFIIELGLTTLSTRSSYFGMANISSDVLIRMGADVPKYVYQGEVYRLFTAMFLHAGILHILMNSASMIAFCSGVQAQVSRVLYIVVYIVGGIQGNMLSDFVHYQWGNLTLISIGASTSISAVMGLYISKLFIESKKNGNVQYNNKQIISMLTSLFIISVMPGVDFFGHFGSLISGCLIGMIGQTNKEQLSLRTYFFLSIIALILYSLILLLPFLK